MQTVCTGHANATGRCSAFWALKETSIEQKRAYRETIASGWCSMICWEMEVAQFYRLPSMKIFRLKRSVRNKKYKEKTETNRCRHLVERNIIAADCHLSTQGEPPFVHTRKCGAESQVSYSMMIRYQFFFLTDTKF